MRNLFFLGSLLINLPFIALSIKMNPKIVNTNLSSSYNKIHNKNNSNENNFKTIGNNNVPPAAFINFNKPEPEPVNAPLPFATQLIVLPIVMKLTATFLVPCTKKLCQFVSLGIENTANGMSKICKRFMSGFVADSRKFACKAMKEVNSLSKMCASASQNIAGAMIDFCDNVGKGAVNTASGAKSWTKGFCKIVYKDIYFPFVTNSAKLITKIAEDVTAWFEDVTIYTFRLIAMISQETAHFVKNLALDTTDFVSHYSIIAKEMIVAYVRGAISTAIQTFLDVPFWFASVAATIIDITTSFATSVKLGLIKTNEEFWLLIENMVDAAPFLVRYEEDGQAKVALSPKAQMALYILSTIYSTQPLWEQSVSSSDEQGGRTIIKSLVSNLQTRFFPPRTLFFAGALARGLQQSSSLKKSFNPTVGVGAIINFGAAALDERWINYIISGWFISGNMWSLFGSDEPEIAGVVKLAEKTNRFW